MTMMIIFRKWGDLIMTGFDPMLVTTSINNVNNAYNELMRALINDTQSKFINPMAMYWACNSAQKFFTEALEPSVTSQANGVNTIFESVVSAMNDAARSWAAQTETSYSPVGFTPNTSKVDVSGVQENINGVRGIDKANATSTVSVLSSIQASVESALNSAKQAVSNCGFVGDAQAETLIGSLDRIKTNISTATKDLTSAVNSAIENTVASYGDTAGKVSEAFSGN